MKRKTLCNCLRSSFSSSRFSASCIRNFGTVNRCSRFKKSRNMVHRGGELSFFQGIHIRIDIRIYIFISNISPKTYDYYIRQASTSTWLDSNQTNQAGPGFKQGDSHVYIIFYLLHMKFSNLLTTVLKLEVFSWHLQSFW